MDLSGYYLKLNLVPALHSGLIISVFVQNARETTSLYVLISFSTESFTSLQECLLFQFVS